MEQETNKQPTKAKGRRGRPKLPPEEKASQTVGPFLFTLAEKQQYDRIFVQSGLKHQAELIRQIMFKGSLKLYYSNQELEKVYPLLLQIQTKLRRIVDNNNIAVETLSTIHKDNIKASEEATRIVELTQQVSVELNTIIDFFRNYQQSSRG
jgi:hypothetical protein